MGKKNKNFISENIFDNPENLPIADFSEIAIREGQYSYPIYRVHRWFARRLATEFRFIISCLASKDCLNDLKKTYNEKINLSDSVILDPFVGGGTSILEALRCNARVIGYDIDPVSFFITNFELSLGKYNEQDFILSKKLITNVRNEIAKYHFTKSGGKIHEVLHHFWVEIKECPKCGFSYVLHPNYRLAYNKQKNIQWVFCKKCGEIQCINIEDEYFKCDCGEITFINEGNYGNGKSKCPKCGFRTTHRNNTKPRYELFAQEYVIKEGKKFKRYFKKATQDDKRLYIKASNKLKEINIKNFDIIPEDKIPTKNRIDSRPLIYGIKKYSDLFNERQLLHLGLLVKTIKNIPDKKIRNLLGIIFSEHLTTNNMYTGYAYGYRRTSPLFSIHSYRHIVRPVELNPWFEKLGRGTYINTFNKIYKSFLFSKRPYLFSFESTKKEAENIYYDYTKGIADNFNIFKKNKKERSILMNKDSEDMEEIDNNFVDIILTDPPYFNNINYSELSHFYYVWLKKLGVIKNKNNFFEQSSYSNNLQLKNLSIENIDLFTDKLSNVFKECYRVLKNEGLFIFTYHHKLPIAWFSLCKAILSSNFKIKSVFPFRSEGKSGFHSYDGTIKWDSVFILVKNNTKESKVENEIIINKKSISEIKEIMGKFINKLYFNEKIGFKKSDIKNLEYSLLVSKAKYGKTNENVFPLKKVLEERSNLCLENYLKIL